MNKDFTEFLPKERKKDYSKKVTELFYLMKGLVKEEIEKRFKLTVISGISLSLLLQQAALNTKA